jgi:hypothetical protein
MPGAPVPWIVKENPNWQGEHEHAHVLVPFGRQRGFFLQSNARKEQVGRDKVPMQWPSTQTTLAASPNDTWSSDVVH